MNNNKDIFDMDMSPYYKENQKIFDNCFVKDVNFSPEYVDHSYLIIDSKGTCNFYSSYLNQLSNYKIIRFDCPVIMHIDGIFDLQNKEIQSTNQLIIESFSDNLNDLNKELSKESNSSSKESDNFSKESNDLTKKSNNFTKESNDLIKKSKNIIKNGCIYTQSREKYFDLIIEGDPLKFVGVEMSSGGCTKVDCPIENDDYFIFYRLEIDKSLRTEEFKCTCKLCSLIENGNITTILENNTYRKPVTFTAADFYDS